MGLTWLWGSSQLESTHLFNFYNWCPFVSSLHHIFLLIIKVVSRELTVMMLLCLLNPSAKRKWFFSADTTLYVTTVNSLNDKLPWLRLQGVSAVVSSWLLTENHPSNLHLSCRTRGTCQSNDLWFYRRYFLAAVWSGSVVCFFNQWCLSFAAAWW